MRNVIIPMARYPAVIYHVTPPLLATQQAHVVAVVISASTTLSVSRKSARQKWIEAAAPMKHGKVLSARSTAQMVSGTSLAEL